MYNYNITPKERALLLEIKSHPEKYLFRKTLFDLVNWTSGYAYAASEFAKETQISILPDGMNHYAAMKYLGREETPMNWSTLILLECANGDEAAAWEMGWEFIDHYLQCHDCVPLTGWHPHSEADMTVPLYAEAEKRDLTEQERAFLSTIKKRPGMYAGKNGFTYLAVFLRGFRCGMEHSGHGGEFLLVPRAFDAYVRTKFPNADGADFADVIHAVQPDDERAMALFWELYEQYLESCGYEKIPEWQPLTDSDFYPLASEEPFYMQSWLAESFRQVFNDAPWNDSWTGEQAHDRICDIMHTPRFDGAAVIRDGKIIAAVLGRGEQYFDGEVFQILEFWVAKELQRQGVGRKLLADFTAYLKEKGICRVFLLTMRSEQTEGFYRKQGFSVQEGMCLMQREL